jgi:hypothetical protein
MTQRGEKTTVRAQLPWVLLAGIIVLGFVFLAGMFEEYLMNVKTSQEFQNKLSSLDVKIVFGEINNLPTVIVNLDSTQFLEQVGNRTVYASGQIGSSGSPSVYTFFSDGFQVAYQYYVPIVLWEPWW